MSEESEAPTKDYPLVPEFARENYAQKAAEIAEREDISVAHAYKTIVDQLEQLPGNEAIVEWITDQCSGHVAPAKRAARKTAAAKADA